MDTLFSCSRLNAVNSFPLAGHMPPEVKDWYQFEAHLSQLRAYGLAESIKDLYWDIRPKPEFGTVEIRVCDTPLTVERACQIAALAQALAVLLMREPDPVTRPGCPIAAIISRPAVSACRAAMSRPTASACA